MQIERAPSRISEPESDGGRGRRLVDADDREALNERRTCPASPLELLLGALGEDAKLAVTHRRFEEFGNACAVRLRLEQTTKLAHVEVVAVVGKLLHEREAALLPHAEVDHPCDDSILRRAVDAWRRHTRVACCQMVKRDAPDERRLAGTGRSDEQDGRRSRSERPRLHLLEDQRLTDDGRELASRCAIDELVGNANELGVGIFLALVGCGGSLAEENRWGPLRDVLAPKLAEVVDPARVFAEQDRAHRVTQDLGGEGEIFHHEPATEAWQRHPVTAAFDRAIRVREEERNFLLADHRALFDRRDRVDVDADLFGVEALVPQVPIDRVLPVDPHGFESCLELRENVFHRGAERRGGRSIEHAVPGAKESADAPAVLVDDDVYAERLLAHVLLMAVRLRSHPR